MGLGVTLGYFRRKSAVVKSFPKGLMLRGESTFRWIFCLYCTPYFRMNYLVQSIPNARHAIFIFSYATVIILPLQH